MNIRNFKTIRTERIIGYHNNRITKKCRLVIGHRFGISVLNLIFVKYNLIKLYVLLNNMLTSSPALNIFFFSINYSYESFLTEFSKESIISLCEKWRPNSIKTKRNHLYSWYENEQTSIIYIPDIYNNTIIITEARRSCIPIISLINVHKPISVDYPIFCNIYSFHIVLWFSKYLIRVIQKETNFFRNQHKKYRPYQLRDSVKLKTLNRMAFKILEKNSNQFKNWKRKIQIWSLRRSEMYLTRERFYLYNTKKPWKDFWFNRFKEKNQGYRFMTMYSRLKARLYRYFRWQYLGRGKKSKTRIYRLGRYSSYTWKTRKQQQYRINITLDLTRFLYNGMFKEMTKRRISGYFFLIKNRIRYNKLQKYLCELFNKRYFHKFKLQRIKNKNLYYRKDKKLKLFWNWIRRSWFRKKRSYGQDIEHIGSRSQKFFKFYRWKYNHNWLSYTYKKKFKSSSNPLFFYSNIFWSRFYTSPALRQLGETLWNSPGNYMAHNIKNRIFSQKGLIMGLDNNVEYSTKHLIWIFNFQSFRKDLTNYVSRISFKGQVPFLARPIQKERNLLWSFKHVIDNDEVIQLDWYKNLNGIKKTFSKRFRTFSNLIHRFIELHRCIKTLSILVRLNIDKKLWRKYKNKNKLEKKRKFIRKRGFWRNNNLGKDYRRSLQTFEQALIWKKHLNIIDSKSLRNRQGVFNISSHKHKNDKRLNIYKQTNKSNININIHKSVIHSGNANVNNFKNNRKDILNNTLTYKSNKNDVRINYTRRNKNRRRNQRRKLNRSKNKDKINTSK